MGTSSNVDVARLTEEVVESLVSAFRFQSVSRKTVSPAHGGNLATLRPLLHPALVDSKRVSVTISVERRPSWTAQLSVSCVNNMQSEFFLLMKF